MNAAIAQHLNVTESAIVRVEEWANVVFTVVRGLGARFISKKVVKMETKIEVIRTQFYVHQDKKQHGPFSRYQIDSVCAEYGVTTSIIESAFDAYSAIEVPSWSSNYKAPKPAKPILKKDAKPFDLEYEMYNPNGTYYG